AAGVAPLGDDVAVADDHAGGVAAVPEGPDGVPEGLAAEGLVVGELEVAGRAGLVLLGEPDRFLDGAGIHPDLLGRAALPVVAGAGPVHALRGYGPDGGGEQGEGDDGRGEPRGGAQRHTAVQGSGARGRGGGHRRARQAPRSVGVHHGRSPRDACCLILTEYREDTAGAESRATVGVLRGPWPAVGAGCGVAGPRNARTGVAHLAPWPRPVSRRARSRATGPSGQRG